MLKVRHGEVQYNKLDAYIIPLKSVNVWNIQRTESAPYDFESRNMEVTKELTVVYFMHY